MSRSRVHAAIAALVLLAAGAAEAQPAPPPANRPAIAVAPDVLARYVGHYRISDQMGVAITLEAGRLYGALTGRPKHELFAETPTRFYATDVDAQVVFEPGADGRAESLVLTIGGEPTEAPRIADPAPATP